MLINRSFGLTLSLPSTILKWFGSNLNGDSADDGEVKENIKIIGGAAISSSHGTATKTDSTGGRSGNRAADSDDGTGKTKVAADTGGAATPTPASAGTGAPKVNTKPAP